MWPNLAGQISPCLIEDPRGHRFWVFSDQIFCSDFINTFFDIKGLLRDHTDANFIHYFSSFQHFFVNFRFGETVTIASKMEASGQGQIGPINALDWTVASKSHTFSSRHTLDIFKMNIVKEKHSNLLVDKLLIFSAMKIQLSEDCVNALRANGHFDTEPREDPVQINATLSVKTFWLLGELPEIKVSRR